MSTAISDAKVIPLSEKKWTRHDSLWVLGIYGCAVSSGSLFWPISLGLAGLWPMIILTLLAFPVTYLTYRVYSGFIMEAPEVNGREGNIIDAVEHYFGQSWAKWVTLFYFITVFPGMMVYTITITNTLIDFMHNQLGLPELPRIIVAPLSVLGLVLLVQGSTTVIVKVMGFIVFPFILSLVFFGIMAIPYWNTSFMHSPLDPVGFYENAASVWTSLPMVIYAFSFTSVVSSFVVAQRQKYQGNAPSKVRQVMFVAVALIILTVCFFSWSCIIALSPADIREAKIHNLTALSYLARKFDNPWLASVSQLIVFTATIKSFLAHFLATKESAKGFAAEFLSCSPATVNSSKLHIMLSVIIYVLTVVPAILNLNVLNLIQIVMVPASVFVVFFLPQYAFIKVPALQKYRGGVINWFVLAIGVFSLINGIEAALR